MHRPDQSPEAMASESGGLGTMTGDAENVRNNPCQYLISQATMDAVVDIMDKTSTTHGTSQQAK
jgi:hypothetical protein